MSGAWIPVWILGAPLVAIVVLSLATQGGSSAFTSYGDRGTRDPR
jgi:hypothetical protein